MIHAEAVMERSVVVEARKTWVLIVSSHIHASRMDVVTNARQSNVTPVLKAFPVT